MISSKVFRVGLLLSLTITTLSGAYSQTSDTIVLNRQHALKVLAKGLQAKELEAQRDLLLTQVDTLKARIAIKEMIVSTLNQQLADYKNIKASQDAIIGTMKEQRSLLQNQILTLNTTIKKQRRKTRWTAFLGVVVAGGLGYLYFTK